MRRRGFALASTIAIGLFVATSSAAPPRDTDPVPPEPRCREGQACGGASACLQGICKAGKCVQTPVTDDRACFDNDNNPCTEARCVPNTGTCNQRARNRPDGTACAGTNPDQCGGNVCRAGACVAGTGGSPIPNPMDVASVEVKARIERIQQLTAFNDCCWTCEHQVLEAMVPTPQGPLRREADGSMPLRRKLCGEVKRFGINDETDDPRDYMLDIKPKAGFEHFLAGFTNTEMTGGGLPEFQSTNCDNAACVRESLRANDPSASPTLRDFLSKRVIHAELTPDESFYGQDARFLPISSGAGTCGYATLPVTPLQAKCASCRDSWNCVSELEAAGAFRGRDVCVYGVYSYDHGEHSASDHTRLCCARDKGHDRPEIHPFDAVWWRHPDAGKNGWIFGVFQDDSNRYSFPHCGDQNNGNTWSEPPRDLTFKFPFSFPRSQGPQKACLRHVKTKRMRDNADNAIIPLNVSTAAMPGPLTEVKSLGGMLEIVEPADFAEETQVRVDGCVTDTEVKGWITVRVAIGCSSRAGMDCSKLSSWNPKGRVDTGDPGAGYFYEELTLERGACP
jgi:hypothetical protein